MIAPFYSNFKACFTTFLFIVCIQIVSAQTDIKQSDIQPIDKNNNSRIVEPTTNNESDKMVQKNTLGVVDENGNPCVKAYVPTAVIKKQEETIILFEPK